MQIVKAKDFHIIEKFLSENFSAPTHWPDWNLVVSKHYNTSFYYLVIYENSEVTGICPVHEEKKGVLSNLYSGQFMYIPNGGWIFNKTSKLTIPEFNLAITNSLSLVSLPVLKEFNAKYPSALTTSRRTLIIDLQKPLDEIWTKDINSKRRNMIRKAEKSGVRIIKSDNADIDEFYSLYHAANTYYKIGVHPIEFFRDLLKYSQNITFSIWYAIFQNKTIGSIVTVNDKNYSIYWLGIGVQGTENFGQGELLQWEAIKEMKRLECKYYDLCHIDKEKLPQIYTFKSGFSNTEIPIVSIRKKSQIYSILNRIQRFLK